MSSAEARGRYDETRPVEDHFPLDDGAAVVDPKFAGSDALAGRV
jgi:hypothetical protein